MKESCNLGSQAEGTAPEQQRPRVFKGLVALAALLPLALLLALLSWSMVSPGTGGGRPGVNASFLEVPITHYQAPDFSATTLDDHEISLSGSRGQVVMLDFWASWCPPCREEAPDLAQVYQEYKDRSVQFIGVAIWDKEGELQKYVDRFQIAYPNALDDRGHIAIQYGVAGIPEKLFIDRQGNVVKKLVGPTDKASLRRVLDQMLAN